MWLAMGDGILSYNIAYHALLSFGRDPGSYPACGGYVFCLDIKKFWYTCEKDKYNDVNKHFFGKIY